MTTTQYDGYHWNITSMHALGTLNERHWHNCGGKWKSLNQQNWDRLTCCGGDCDGGHSSRKLGCSNSFQATVNSSIPRATSGGGASCKGVASTRAGGRLSATNKFAAVDARMRATRAGEGEVAAIDMLKDGSLAGTMGNGHKQSKSKKTYMMAHVHCLWVRKFMSLKIKRGTREQSAFVPFMANAPGNRLQLVDAEFVTRNQFKQI